MKKLFILCVVLSIWMFGCGSENSGKLSVSAPTASNGIVTATAKFAPTSGTALPGQPINFSWHAVGMTSKTQTPEITTTVHTDDVGTATSQYKLPASRTESYIVYVSASTGDLTNIEGMQSIQVDP
jgi:hypothetical protein